MKIDPIVQQVREIRHEIERECERDPAKYYQHLRTLQENLGARVVRREPKPLPTGKQKEAG